MEVNLTVLFPKTLKHTPDKINNTLHTHTKQQHLLLNHMFVIAIKYAYMKLQKKTDIFLQL